MAHVAIDARIVRSWSSGIGVYVTELLQALTHVAPQHAYVLLASARAAAAPLPSDHRVEQRPVSYGIGGLGQHLRLPQALRSLGVDVLIVAHPAAAPLGTPCPRLVVVHDLIPLALPEYYSAAKRLYYRTAVRWSLRGAAKVLVDSEMTRRDCERLLGLPQELMRVVYPGVGGRFEGVNSQTERSRERPYLLYVGNKRPHKNVDLLIRAFGLLVSQSEIACELVIAGRDEPGDIETDGRRLRALADSLSLNGRVRFVGEVPGEALPALYAGAEALVYLSSYEGFGLPPLEAMACGTPVVALSAASLPEVVGDGGLLVDRPDPPVVADALRRLLADRSQREELGHRARRRARQFSWGRAARACAEEIEVALRAEGTR